MRHRTQIIFRLRRRYKRVEHVGWSTAPNSVVVVAGGDRWKKMASFAQSQGSRVFHLMMILPAGMLLLLLSLVSLSTLAVTNKRLVDKYKDISGRDDATCILYTEADGNSLKPNEGDECAFGIVGGAILVILAVAFAVILVIKAVIGVSMLSIWVLIELAMSIGGAVWAFIVSVVITAGLDATCSAWRDSWDAPDNEPCCSFYLPGSDNNDREYFYEGLNTSRITAWLTMVLLMLLSGMYTVLLVTYCCTGKRTTTTTVTTSADDKPV